MDLREKVAIVTGSSRGVGRATALALSRQGAAVVVNYNRSRDAAEDVVKEIHTRGGRAAAHQADVSDDAACRGLVEVAHCEFGGLDVLVNNAGTTRFIAHSDLDAVTDEVWDEILGVNVKGPFQCIRAALSSLRESGDAEIVNVASVAGFSAAGSCVPYGASKAALINMTVNLARAGAEHSRQRRRSGVHRRRLAASGAGGGFRFRQAGG